MTIAFSLSLSLEIIQVVLTILHVVLYVEDVLAFLSLFLLVHVGRISSMTPLTSLFLSLFLWIFLSLSLSLNYYRPPSLSLFLSLVLDVSLSLSHSLSFLGERMRNHDFLSLYPYLFLSLRCLLSLLLCLSHLLRKEEESQREEEVEGQIDEYERETVLWRERQEVKPQGP
jgi:hypothetical protein